ncbi:hypothetical protein IJ750_01235 [bacterium]|nr:hypothetical protein [bacterium]
MSTYSFKITKGIYQLSLSTTDKELVVEQFALWVKKASQYAQNRKIQECKTMVNNQISKEEQITRQKIDEQLSKLPEHKPIEDFDNQQINDTGKDLDAIYSPEHHAEQEHSINTQEKVPESTSAKINNFENILDRSIHNPDLAFKPTPSIKKDNAFLNYIGDRKIDRKIDYLLLTAYYFTQYEQKPRFTLKQLNAKLMQNLAVIIDHSILQEAINRDYIECLPDLTGIVGASEYRLTAYGEKTLMEE